MTWAEATATAVLMAPLLIIIIAALVNFAMWLTKRIEGRREKRRARG